jgi:hypothetical protein
MCTQGFLRNLGGRIVSASSSRDGRPIKQPRPGDHALVAPRSEDRVQARYRCVKGTKREGTGEQASKHSVVPTKRGNAPERTPWMEGDAGTWTRWRDR